ncbi:MAG: hypothetical protein AAF597_14790, partial [Bacteroidota bacterium]
NNNTLGGVGGIRLGATLDGMYRLLFTWSNLDDQLVEIYPSGTQNREKNYNVIIDLSRISQFNRLNMTYGLTYLYVYERSTFQFSQFSSVDHYVGVNLGFEYLLGRRFGPYIDYHFTPFRLSDERAFGYAHNVNLGLVVKLGRVNN